jgi:alkylation response protein AidB-like acyl-CoA dehydrogenase
MMPHQRLSPRSATLEHMRQAEAAIRATKLFVERSCIDIVDKCLAMTGGGGYLSHHPIARHYRDVRALPFMVPQATESVQYIGMVALGLPPALDL